MRRLILCAALLALTSILPIGCTGSDSEKEDNAPDQKRDHKEGDRLIILTNGESPFWDAGRQGMEAAAKDLELDKAGLKIDFQVNDDGETGQLKRLRQIASQSDVAAIAISVTKEDNKGIADQLRELKRSGVHVLTIDSDVNRQKYRRSPRPSSAPTTSQAGRELGRCAKLLRPDGGEYVTFVGYPEAQNAKERMAGFKEGAGDKFNLVDNMADQTDRTEAKRERPHRSHQPSQRQHPGRHLVVQRTGHRRRRRGG